MKCTGVDYLHIFAENDLFNPVVAVVSVRANGRYLVDCVFIHQAVGDVGRGGDVAQIGDGGLLGIGVQAITDVILLEVDDA